MARNWRQPPADSLQKLMLPKTIPAHKWILPSWASDETAVLRSMFPATCESLKQRTLLSCTQLLTHTNYNKLVVLEATTFAVIVLCKNRPKKWRKRKAAPVVWELTLARPCCCWSWPVLILGLGVKYKKIPQTSPSDKVMKIKAKHDQFVIMSEHGQKPEHCSNPPKDQTSPYID